MNILIADDETYMLKILEAYFDKEECTVFLAEDLIKTHRGMDYSLEEKSE